MEPMLNPLARLPVEKATGRKLFIKTVLARAYPRIMGQQREKSWVFFDIFLPMLAVSSYVFVYRAIHAPEAYVGFVVIGGAMTAFWMNIMWSMSSQLYWEKEQGNLALYIMAPNSMMAVLLGMALGGMLATFIRAIAIIALGSLFFHVQYAIGSFPNVDRNILHSHDGAVWHGDDERIAVPAVEPGGGSPGATGDRAGIPGVRASTSRSDPSTSGSRRRHRSSRSHWGWTRCGNSCSRRAPHSASWTCAWS